jgi:predicted MFS family arabinose efflux permease
MNQRTNIETFHTGVSGEPQTKAMHPIISEWKQSWRPGIASLVGSAVGISVWPTVSSLFVEPLQQSFGWSRGEISFAFNASLVAAVCAPLLGRLIDRTGVRRVLITGLLLTALCYTLLAMMNGSLGYYYAVYLALTVIGITTSGLTYTRIVTGVFVKSRGFALAVTRSGIAISGALLPALVFAAISKWGLTGGYMTLAALILFIALPTAWFWVPSLRPGLDQAPQQARAHAEWLRLLRRPKVLLLCLASGLNYAPVVALMTQMMPLAQSKGLSAGEAVTAVSAVGLAALCGALVSGFLIDRFWAPMIAFIFNVGPAIGCLLLLQADVPPWLLLVSVLMIGLGQGAEIDVVAYMIARYFGLANYAAIYGLSVLFIALFVAIGASAIGASYDFSGSYDFALTVAATSFALAAVCYLLMGRYPRVDRDAITGR